MAHPRNGEICVALNSAGKRCARRAIVVEHYHGDDELYNWFDNKVTWVRAAFCAEHRTEDKKGTK